MRLVLSPTAHRSGLEHVPYNEKIGKSLDSRNGHKCLRIMVIDVGRLCSPSGTPPRMPLKSSLIFHMEQKRVMIGADSAWRPFFSVRLF